MKKIYLLFVFVFVLFSCENTIEKNSTALQGKVNNVFWKASNVSANKAVNGTVKLTGIAANETLEIKLSSTNVGVYELGTSNLNNQVSYLIGENNNFKTQQFPNSVNEINLINEGSGYTDAISVATSGGSGNGLKVNILASALTGEINDISVNAPGNNYISGDIITVLSGNNNATFEVKNVEKSNGEVIITESKNGTISGTFKFTAVNEITSNTATMREGIFYKVPVN